MKAISSQGLLIRMLIIMRILMMTGLGVSAAILSAHAKPDTSLASIHAVPPHMDTAPKNWLKQLIVQEAEKSANVTPSVALAVARIESSFRPRVVSSAGAIGVMQIMPRTGRDLFGLSQAELFDPATNIRAGVTFLDQLIQRYDGRIDLALSHYNGGSRVASGPQPKIIPATRGYVLKVLAAARAYQAQGVDTADETASDEGITMAGYTSSTLPLTSGASTAAVPAPIGSFAPVAGKPVWQQYLNEADFWVAAAMATRDAGALPEMQINGDGRYARALVKRLQDNRQAFRHWLKASR